MRPISNEVRKDYLLARWVIIAAERARRPSDFMVKREERFEGVCPFCPGNEHMTPPATLLYLWRDGVIEKSKDSGCERKKGWLIRCFQNLYPALKPLKTYSIKPFRMDPAGHHEVLVESPIHEGHPHLADVSQLKLMVEAYVDRLKELSKHDYVKYISIFRNHGKEAGASLSHAHSQIIATPIIPKLVNEELNAASKYFKLKGSCSFCTILRKESRGPRLIHETKCYAVIAPWASINPFEFWIIPKRHEACLSKASDEEVEGLAHVLREAFGALAKLLNNPPYNFWLHIAPNPSGYEFYHWHLEVHPKLSIWAGFEKGFGIYINTVPPETAAQSLREVLKENFN